jgi:acetyltransferase-like isoleucine patch superfamily enzyme
MLYEFKKVGIQNVQFGKNVRVIEPCNLYNCFIGDDCFVGPFVEIQQNAVIEHDTKIQSHCFICEMVTIGHHCFIGHGVMFVNDVFTNGKPAGGNKSLWKRTIIGNYVNIGSNATILPVNICDGAVIGAGAVVTKNIEVPGVYVGNPAKLLKSIP